MKKHGISLIVLVITIIVMIIIAGAIILTLTQTNIIDQAETAVNKSNEKELKQRISLVFTEAQTNKYIAVEYSVEDNLKVIFEEVYGKDNVTVVKSGNNYKVKLKESNEVLKVKTDGTIEEYKEMAPTKVYARLDDEGVLYLRATEKEGYNLYVYCNSIQPNWNTNGDATPASVIKIILEEEIAPTIANSMFAHMSNLVQIENIYNLHTENIADMNYMFDGCEKLESLDVSNFDTSKVIKMAYMFVNCKKITTLDLSSFDTSSTIKFADMFNGCANLTSIDVTSFNTSKAEDMIRMFANCIKLTNLDVSNFYINKNVKLGGMFSNCQQLEKIDLSNFDTTNITEVMRDVFNNCKNLKTLVLSNKFIINDGVDLKYILWNVPSDIKITAIESTRDKLIEASTLTVDNFEIIEEAE